MKSQTQNIMKQFNLDEYLANPSKKVVTRDGRKAGILCTDAKGDYPIVALVEEDDGEYSVSCTKNGRYYPNEIDDKNDLFFATLKNEGWMNIYKARNYCYGGSVIYPTEVAAKTAADPDPVATIKIEWEE